MSILRRALATGALAVLHTGAVCLFVGAVGCEQKAPARSTEPPRGLPPLEPSAAMPRAEHPRVDPAHGVNPHGAAMGSGGMGTHGGAHPPEAMPEGMSPGDIPFDKSTVIAGTFRLDPKLKAQVKEGDVIYLVVRGVGSGDAPGPVLAVRRLTAAAFPMPFQIDSRDAMVAGTQLKAPVVVSVRVDKDGDAMTKNPGDVTGSATISALPAPKLSLALDKVL